MAKQLGIPNFWYWLTAIITLSIDQGTKFTAKVYLEGKTSLPLWEGVLHLTYATNDGAAFSFLAGQVDWLRWISLAVSLALLVAGIVYKRWTTTEQFAYGFILAGALGNGIDRFAYGYVVDFLEIRLFPFPIFNSADVAINIGIALLILAIVREGQSTPR
jgi:signal peptidase II